MGTGFPVLARSATPGNTTEWITNFPPMGMYEQTFSDSLNEVGLGAAREHKHLKALQELGFRVMLALHAGQNLETASDLPADAALLVIRSDGDLKKIRDGYLDVVRNVLGADIPLVMHGGPERHLPNNPQALGADAVLDMPR
jgi:predicted TIM-barrel enzyme